MVRIRLRAAVLPLLVASSAAAFDPDFSFYPKNAQSCLNKAASSSKCSGATSKELNTCFCSNNGNFITSTAKCLGSSDKADVQKVYSTMLQACTDSNTPMSVSQSDFIKAANGDDTSMTTTITTMPTTPTATRAITTTTKGGQTVTITPTSTGDGGNNGGGGDGLSNGATIGIAVGASLAGVAVLGGIGVWLLRRRRRGSAEESRPMLVQPEYYHHMTGTTTTTTTFPPSEPSPDLNRFSAVTDPKMGGGWSPSSGLSPHKSPSPYPAQFTPSPTEGVVLSELPSQGAMAGHGSEVFEMDATSAPRPADGHAGGGHGPSNSATHYGI
ncbi:hypothetical protein O9K51_08296 [Purpureocillium lavendulum]|uniref:Extracellular membrane protein CFEM domain-containing protein n=1 Tax=Purpureocillium lavendulum TaxID=1247861 RepID=A0AB34FHM1_9HYPO|nr:hypothetical protein O9K51_08296 [Purpureocillium lavendulum]